MSDVQLPAEPGALLVIDMQCDRREQNVIAGWVRDAATFAAGPGQSTAVKETAE